tara:strand:+ start:4565 stop:6280 length:1716 start_codon:yes stop_codon:yes gene_type:complete
MKNNLEKDPSPYLQQHKKNPVFWQCWSKDILSLAKKEQKPILLSIGYASCHWCHVMAHESFEDQETADIMNNNFINVKVDREERPDIDFVFQSSFQLFNNTGGGWPLTMFLDENGVPFIGGTYFPKVEQNGLPAFKTLLQKVHEAYKEQKIKIINQAELIKKSLELKKNPVINQELEPILEILINNLDPLKGGYKGSPKFPTFNVHETLLYFFNKKKDEKFLKPVEVLLNQICSKGIYDHVQGGISRYTVDENWLIPHFEKMLYDNVQFVLLLSKYLKNKSNKYFENKLIQTINFLNLEFKEKNSFLLGSAYDADSDGEEGKYYVFSYDEIKNIKKINEFFDVKPEGNWEGKIILSEKKEAPADIIEQLLKIRKNKIKPFFDNKTQLDLNSLWVSALVKASLVLPKKNYLKLAVSFFENIEKKFSKNSLFHSYSHEIVFIEDYAFFIQALIDLADTTLQIEYRIKAKEYSKLAIDKFYSKSNNIFQKTPLDSDDIFFKPIDISDHTVPNGNAIMLLNLTKLGFEDEAKKLSISLNGYLNNYKSYMASSIRSLDFFNEYLKNKKCTDEGCLL